MPNLSYTDPSPVHQAEALLEAWICGDTAGLEEAFHHIGHCCVRPIDRGEHTRLKLLKAVARGLKACPNRYAPRNTNPVLGLYLDLLIFLSNGRPVSGELTEFEFSSCEFSQGQRDQIAIQIPIHATTSSDGSTRGENRSLTAAAQ